MDRERSETPIRPALSLKRRWLGAIGWTVLAALGTAIVGYILWPTKTTFHLTAQTEELWIHTPRQTKTDSSVVGTSALTFGRVLLEEEDRRRSLDGVGVRVTPGATIRLVRMLPDTLAIIVEAEAGTESAGTMYDGEHFEGALGPDPLFLVPLSGKEANSSFLLSFRARRLEVGNVPGFSTGQRTPLLRSGEVKLVARTPSKQEFDAGSYTLRAGQRIILPAPGSTTDEIGTGLVLVEDGPGMTVSFTTYTRRAAIASDGEVVRLTPGVFDRAKSDLILAVAWVLLVTLILGPLGSVVADRMKALVESLINRQWALEPGSSPPRSSAEQQPRRRHARRGRTV